ncbi:MAG: Uma2 family endonuclease [Deltaproteobacteria bacterium]|nr:Uma2 family endonuclease [Deltaproteobacteria bacterium]
MAPRSKARRATYQDVLDAPAWLVAEMVEGELRTSPRPSPRHAYAETRLASLIDGPFGRGLGGPGGWIVLAEPELHLDRDEAILVPDLAAWRCERLPALPEEAFVKLPPDWICEILSPASAAFDRERKLPVYARTGVAHAWLVDPILRTLEVLAGRSGGFTSVSAHRDAARVRAEPFAAVEIDLGELWAR